MSYELVGHVGVDAGLIWVGDPCYVVAQDSSHSFESWSDFCDLLQKNEKDGVTIFSYQAGHEGMGIAISSGWGDGCYPVYVKRKDGRIKELKVVFF